MQHTTNAVLSTLRAPIQRMGSARPIVPALAACAATALLTATASAQPVTMEVDEDASFIELTLELIGYADTDAAPVAGTITVDPTAQAETLTFHGYNLALTENINLVLGGGFLGSLQVNFVDMTVIDDFQGETFAAPMVGDLFTLPGAPSLLSGALNYNASGLFCVALEGYDMPCQAAQDLAELGTVWIVLAGTAEVIDNTLHLTMTVDASTPLSPDNPDLGTLTVSGTIIGSADLPTPLPCPGDLDGNGQVDADDLGLLLGAFGNNDAGDLNDDGITNADDLGLLLSAFGIPCQ